MAQLHKTRLSIVGAIALAATAGGAQATEVLPLWTGFYIGGHVGGAWAEWDTDTRFVAVQPGTSLVNTATFPGPNENVASLIGGAQIGYNWQQGRGIFGVLATISGLGFGSDENVNIPAASLVAAGVGAITSPVDGFVSTWDRQVEWLATFRAQLGFLVTPRALLFVTGGGAVGAIDANVSYTGLVQGAGGAQTTLVQSRHKSWDHWGWTIGGGLEGMIADNSRWRIRAEYLFVDLGTIDQGLGTYIQTACCVQTVTSSAKVHLHVATIGLNYRFGGP